MFSLLLYSLLFYAVLCNDMLYTAIYISINYAYLNHNVIFSYSFICLSLLFLYNTICHTLPYSLLNDAMLWSTVYITYLSWPSQLSPTPLKLESVCAALPTIGQLSHSSPTPSPSVSVWATTNTRKHTQTLTEKLNPVTIWCSKQRKNVCPSHISTPLIKSVRICS